MDGNEKREGQRCRGARPYLHNEALWHFSTTEAQPSYVLKHIPCPIPRDRPRIEGPVGCVGHIETEGRDRDSKSRHFQRVDSCFRGLATLVTGRAAATDMSRASLAGASHRCLAKFRRTGRTKAH